MRTHTYFSDSKSSLITTKQAWAWLGVLCIGHLVLWTLVSSWTRGSVTHDTLEGIAWGMQWQWGYDKHPPLAAWLSALATQMGGTVGWPVYLMSQVAVVVTFVAVFLLALEIFPIGLALVATLLSEGILYHNINSINFTPDTMQTPLWALATYFFYLALTRQRAWAWIGVGLTAGLCVLAKYSAAFLFAPMFCLLVLTAEGRKSWRNPAFYGALALACVVVAPHLLWALGNGLTGVKYINNSLEQGVGEAHLWFNHIKHPFRFLISQLGVIAGALVLAWPLWRAKRQTQIAPRFETIFILAIGVLPFALTIFYALLTGHRIIPRWATPYFFLIGPVLILALRPVLTPKKLKQICYTTLVAFLLVVVLRGGYFVLGPTLWGKSRSDAYLPNQQIAQKVTSLWHEKFARPLPYIAGDHYLSAFISAYSKDKPQAYMSWSATESPWVDEAELKKKGAVFAWEVKSPTENVLPAHLSTRYPRAKMVDVFAFNKLISIPSTPLYVAVAILEPTE